MDKGSVQLMDATLLFSTPFEQAMTLKGRVMRVLRRRRLHAESFAALEGLTLEVSPGETFGIIGANGSGKSSLLKLVAGVYAPSRGHVATTGRVTALLELGTGFHTDLTGRENILLNGLVLGMTRREIVQREEEIVEFSGLGRFIDAPVRHYSAGMFMRLGFSVAAHADPDIFLIDEVLGVGDEAFQHRCFPRIREFQAQGKTILFASHDLATLAALCRRGIWLHQGRVMALGPMPEVVQHYRDAVGKGEGGSIES